jgi:hypothetical protein
LLIRRRPSSCENQLGDSNASRIAAPIKSDRLLGRIDAFVPAYATALFVIDLITAVLLFAQFSILRSRAGCSPCGIGFPSHYDGF